MGEGRGLYWVLVGKPVFFSINFSLLDMVLFFI
jgi:hypothetical protein